MNQYVRKKRKVYLIVECQLRNIGLRDIGKDHSNSFFKQNHQWRLILVDESIQYLVINFTVTNLSKTILSKL